jgi:Putative zinc-finger
MSDRVTHLTEELIEGYILRSLAAEQAIAAEEHLFECAECRTRLVEEEEFLHAFREAAPEFETRARSRVVTLPRASRVWVPLAAAAVLIAAIYVTNLRTPQAAPAVVVLQAMRGPESGAAIPARQPAVLIVELPSEKEALYDAEVVDGDGATVLHTRAALEQGRLSVAVNKLAAGTYWVRVYRAEPSRELVREYRLRAN